MGPPLHVVGFNGSSGTLPADGVIQIAFDRLLHPASVTRQSFALADKSGRFLEPVITYDPVARVVTLRAPASPASWLEPGVTYSVTMGVSALNDYLGLSGPRAIDGALLPAKVVETFQVVPVPATQTPSPDRAVNFCNDVLPIFQLRCSGGLCHAAPVPRGPNQPAEGLILQTSTGVINTAIGTASHGRTSQESNTGGVASPPGVQGRPFGVDMAIVNPLDGPGQSWLMYKVLLGQRRAIDKGLDAGIATCGPGASAPAPVLLLPSPQPAASLTLSASEQEILSQFILGNQMPYPLNLPPNAQTPVSSTDDESSTLPLTFDELERVRAWIAQGANVSQCASCPQ